MLQNYIFSFIYTLSHVAKTLSCFPYPYWKGQIKSINTQPSFCMANILYLPIIFLITIMAVPPVIFGGNEPSICQNLLFI